MEEDIEQKILMESSGFGDIEDLTEETIFNDEIYYWLIAINGAGERQKQKRKLIEKAKELGVKPDFCEFLKQCEKDFKREEKQQNKKKVLLKQSHNEIGDTLLQNNNMYIFENDICIYEEGVYKKNEKDISKKILELVPDSTIYFRNEVYQYLLLKTEEKQFDRENGIINFKNGLYDLNKRKLLKHTPEFFSTNQININLNLQAQKVQAIDEVLDKLSCGIYERKQTILEMIGYCMTTSVKLQKAFILYGNKARNGKSTLINLISKLIGKENVGQVSFEDLNTKQFATVGIKGKLLNIGSEMTKEYLKDVSKFKEWTTGDDLEIEEKFKPRQTIRPYAKFIFSANELPRVADKTDGFYRRIQLIPLEYSFTNKDRKLFDFNKLISNEALEYLAKISLEAYLNIKEDFSNYKESENEINKYKSKNNNVLLFLEDVDYIRLFIESNVATKKAVEVYEYYKRYCKENGDVAIGRNSFYKEIEQSKHVSKGKINGWITYTFDTNYYISK